MTASKKNFGGSQPARRVASPTCRRTGCGHPASSPKGFCTGCKLDYRRSLASREVDLYATARLLAAANPEWADTFAHALPGQYELMLTHAAAHHLQYGGPAHEAISLLALQDYLADTMDRVRDVSAGESL